MSDVAKKLAEKYSASNRYSNFGACLRSVFVDGFRGIRNLSLEIDYPVIAISGLNGAGKTTLGQLAICAYKVPSSAVAYRRKYIKDYFPISLADPKPIEDEAMVVYYYETSDQKKAQEVTVTRANSAWSGYKRQPERHCFYVGFTVYIPKVERADLSVYGGATLQFTEKRKIENDIIAKMARVIGHKYEDLLFQGVSHKSKESEIGIASRLGYSYSENNMGFGEGRVLYTIDKLETAPERSLFIIEEPETALHENAQYEFSKYLLDVCDRRRHQIIISTHSSVILDALPSVARKLLVRDKDGVVIRNRISTNQVRSILSSGRVRDLYVCVEDIFAKILLIEILRIKSKDLLKVVEVVDVGDKNAVRECVIFLRKIGKKALAVRDADVGQDVKNHIYSFPGSRAPEIEVFAVKSVQEAILKQYDVDVDWVLERNDVKNHHKIAKSIAAEAEAEESVVRAVAINQYVVEIEHEFDDLVSVITAECS